MKNLLYILILLSCKLSAQTVVLKSADGAAWITSPGTYVIQSSQNPWTNIYIKASNVTVLHSGSVEMSGGIQIEDQSYIKIGDEDTNGFKIKNKTGAALSISGKSAHIEASGFYADSCQFGVWCKNEASCDDKVNEWIIDDINIHHYKITDAKIEGMYLGSTDPDNATRPIVCNGFTVYPKPSKLGNIKVHDGVVNGSGRGGIQLCNAPYGSNEIYNNNVTRSGKDGDDSQGAGIIIGTYTNANIYGNYVSNTLTWGIASIGGLKVTITNNMVKSSGNVDGYTLAWPNNIFIDTRSTSPVDSTRFVIMGNNLANPASLTPNIQVYYTYPTYYSTGNIICGNVGEKRYYVYPAVNYESKCSTLPVKLTSFTVERSGKSVLLRWAVEGADKIEIQRAGDGRTFSTIGKFTTERQALDLIPLPGKNFYRLKIFEQDEYSYSPVRVVNTSKTVQAIYNAAGQKVEGMTSGVYFIRYTDGTTETVLKTNQ